jgi:hypothetical protein
MPGDCRYLRRTLPPDIIIWRAMLPPRHYFAAAQRDVV